MNKFEIKNHEPSWLPEGDWKLAWADEFDGTELDRTTWDYRLCITGKRWPSWTDKGVHLDGNSNVVFTLIEEDGMPVCSQLQTGQNYMDEPVQAADFCGHKFDWKIGKLRENRYLHGYGYYECRCRLQQKPGWWSAFWIQSPIIGSSLDPKESGVEIDIMESFTPGNIAGHNVFTGGYGVDSKRRKVGGLDQINKEEFHRFGLLWDETGYTFYVDGIENGKITDFITDKPEFLLLSTEVRGYRQNDKPVEEAFDAIGDTFVVDYIRVFDKVK